MNDLSLHILDIAENCINAGAKNIEIIIDENTKTDELIIEINDDGKGMDEETVKKLTDPFFTSRTTRKVGLGIPLFKEAAENAGGSLKIDSKPGTGTKIKAVFENSHIDRKPLGDVAETLISLILLSNEAEIIYKQLKNEKEFDFNTKELKEQLGTGNLKEPGLLIELKKILKQKLTEIQ